MNSQSIPSSILKMFTIHVAFCIVLNFSHIIESSLTNPSAYYYFCEGCKPAEQSFKVERILESKSNRLLPNNHFQRFDIRSKRSKMGKIPTFMNGIIIKFQFGGEKTRDSHRKRRAFQESTGDVLPGQ